MFSSLSAGVATPPWDREVFRAIQDALFGVPRGEPPKVVWLVNGSARVYRTVVADGPADWQSAASNSALRATRHWRVCRNWPRR